MKTIKGQNLRVKLTEGVGAGKNFAGAQTCTVHAAAQVEEVTTKDSTGDWAENEATGKSWDGSTDGLVIIDPTDTASLQGMDMFDLIGKTVEIEFYQAEGEMNRAAKTGGIKRHGTAIINDVNQTYANKQNGSYTVSWTGTGELKKKTNI